MIRFTLALALIAVLAGFKLLSSPGGGGVPCGALQFNHTVVCNAISIQVFGS